jgi:CubicO group peptidase (beta-lactamase class C family)
MFEKFIRSAVSITLMLMLVTPAFAQSATSENTAAPGLDPQRLGRIDTAINEEIAAGKIPGAVALIAHNGKLVYHKSFGFADLDSQTPMQTNSIFRIASMTKAITSVAVMVLYEQGRFRLSDPVSRYIPAFTDMTLLSGPDEDGKTSRIKATKPIRIIDLLTHSSGISYPFIASNVQQDYLDAGMIDGLTAKDITLKSQMELLAKQPLMFEPGSRWAYGLSTDLLGYLVEVVSGQPLDQFFEENIFVPLAMHDSYFFLPNEKADRLVTLYADVEPGGLIVSKGNESNIILDNPRYPVEGARRFFSGGAGLSSTAYDYARFCQMLLNTGTLDGKRILSRKSVELMRAPRAAIDDDGRADFSLGFFVNTDLGQSNELGSVGTLSWGGAFNTAYWIDPAENLVAIIMTQVRPVSSDINDRFQILVYQALE